MDHILELWPVLVVIVTVIIWLVRLESKVIYLESVKTDLQLTIKAMTTEHDELKNRMYDQLSIIKETLVRLETTLNLKKE